MVSAWYSSVASISPDTRALARSIPFPCDTATDRELGRLTMTTGMPTESSPVTFATRVIPITGARRSTRLSVSSRLADRCVPRRKTFSVTPIKIQSPTGRGRSRHSSIVSEHFRDSNSHTRGEVHRTRLIEVSCQVVLRVFESDGFDMVLLLRSKRHRNRVFINDVVVAVRSANQCFCCVGWRR